MCGMEYRSFAEVSVDAREAAKRVTDEYELSGVRSESIPEEWLTPVFDQSIKAAKEATSMKTQEKGKRKKNQAKRKVAQRTGPERREL